MKIQKQLETGIVGKTIDLTSTELIVLKDMAIELDQHYAKVNPNPEKKFTSSVRLLDKDVDQAKVALGNAISFLMKVTEDVQGIIEAKHELFDELGIESDPLQMGKIDLSKDVVDTVDKEYNNE
jgi:hypothetical protein